MKNAVQSAVANPSTNYGWIFVDDGNDGHGYYTSQYTNATQRPKLTVTYSTPVETRYRLPVTADNAGMFAAAVRGATAILSWKPQGAANISVSRADGRVVMERRLSGETSCSIDNLSPGIYFTRMNGTDRNTEVRFTVTR